jgi:4-amino-4-deoxy-L-arabinose transferase-like glycosyltransferase
MINAVVTAKSLTSIDWRRGLVLALVLAAHIALVWTARSPGVLTGQDDAEYILLGRALAQGSYRELWRVDTPVHSQYPPGYPALLAIWQSVTGASHSSRVVLSAVLSSATLVLLFGAARRRLGPFIAAASVGVLAVNPFFVQYGGSVATEMPYVFCSVACLYALIRSEDARKDGAERASTIWLVAAVVATLAAAQMRSVGIALVGALVFWLLWAGRWRAAIGVSLAAAVTFGVWLGWTFVAPEQFVGRSYVADVFDSRGGSFPVVMLRRVADNAWNYMTLGLLWVMAVPTIQGTIADNVAGLLILGVTLVGGLYVFWRQWREGLLYLATYSFVVLVFRWQATRFLAPLVVLLVPGVLAGAAALARWIGPRLAAPVTVLTAILLGYGGVARSATLVAENDCARNEGIPSPDCTISAEEARYFDALRYVQSNLPDDAVFLTAKSGALYYYTGRRSVTVEGARVQHPDDFIDFVKSQGAGFILLSGVDDIERGFFAPRLQVNCRRLVLVQSFPPSVLLFSLNGDIAASDHDNSACEAIESFQKLNPPRN